MSGAELMTREKVSRWKLTLVNPLLIMAILVLAAGIRIVFFPYMNNDLSQFHLPWFRYLSQHNGLFAIKDFLEPKSPFQGLTYSPTFFYLMVALLPFEKWVPPVILMKSMACVFDFVSAAGVYLIIRNRYPTGFCKWAGFLAVCFSPTVIINSAYWGQVDSVYTSLLVFSLFLVCIQRPGWSLVFFSSALAFKIQALIFAPVILVLLFRKKIGWTQLMIIPAVYLLWMVPAYLCGYPLLAPFTAIFNVAGAYTSLTMNAPTQYAFIPNRYFDQTVPLGVALASLGCLGLLWMAIKGKWELNQADTILLTVTLAVMLPFILPKMHERYFYPAALFSILLIFYYPKLRIIPLVLQVTSLISYVPFLRGYELMPLFIPAIINGCVLAVLIASIFKHNRTTPPISLLMEHQDKPI